VSDSDAGTTPDIDDTIPGPQVGEVDGQMGGTVAAEQERHGGHEAADTGEARMGGVVVGGGQDTVIVGRCAHAGHGER
jgi:hypothetical protein